MDLFVFIVVGLAGSIITYLIINHQQQVKDAIRKEKEDFDKKWVVAKRGQIKMSRGRQSWLRTVVIQKHPDTGEMRAYATDNGNGFVSIEVSAAIKAIGEPD